MKAKHLLLATAAVFGLAACQEGTVANREIKDNTIEFRTLTGNTQRGAQGVAPATSTTIQDFRIYSHQTDAGLTDANMLMKGIEIVKADGLWGYKNETDKTPWPIFTSGTDALDFYAISPSVYELTVDDANNAISLVDFTVAPDAADQVDLLYGVNLNEDCEEGNRTNAVAVNFEHALAQIAFNIVKTADCPYTDIRVNGIRLVGVNQKGTFTVPLLATSKDGKTDATKDNWAVDATTLDITTEFAAIVNPDMAAAITPAPATTDDGNLFIIPQQIKGWDRINDKTNTDKNAYILIDCNVRDKEGVYIWGDAYEYETVAVPVPANYDAADPENGTNYTEVVWQPGVKYHYTLNFGKGIGFYPPTDADKPGEPVIGNWIDFTVDVDNYTEGTDDKVLLY